jgi:hypothetical protein
MQATTRLARSGTHQISDSAIDPLIERFVTVPSPLSLVALQQLGNAANRDSAATTAFSHRDAIWEWARIWYWLEPASDAVNIQWAREL